MQHSSLRNIGMVVGLGHGDEGKGMSALTYAYLHATANQRLIACKGNGSGQATHKVMLDLRDEFKMDDFWFIHSYYSGATFAPLATANHQQHTFSTILTPDIVIELVALLTEAKKIDQDLDAMELESDKALQRPVLYIHKDSLVTTPLDIHFNGLRELLNTASHSGKHGTCGIGFYDTLTRSRELRPLRVSQIMDNSYKSYIDLIEIHAYYCKLLNDKLVTTPIIHDDVREAVNLFINMPASDISMLSASFDYYCQQIRKCEQGLHRIKVSVYSEFEKIVTNYDTLLIESNQGVLIGDEHGVMPHATPSDTTGKTALTYALTALEESGVSLGDINFTYLGVSRIFSTRHGNGAFVHKKKLLIPEVHKEHVICGYNAFDMPYSRKILKEEHNVHNREQGSLRWSLLSVDNLAFVYNDFNEYLETTGYIHRFKSVTLALNLSHMDALQYFNHKFEYIFNGMHQTMPIRDESNKYIRQIPAELIQLINTEVTGVPVSMGVTATGPRLRNWVGGYLSF